MSGTGTVLSQQKAAVHCDASHETPSLIHGERKELLESDSQPMVEGSIIDFLSGPSNPAHFIILSS